MTKVQDRNRKLFKKVKETTVAWMEVSTAHGIPNIARTDSLCISFLWLSCLIVSTGICIYLTLSSINKYMEFEKFNKYSVVYETSTVFPSVTVCNTNPFVTQEAFDFVQKVLIDNNITNILALTQFGKAPTDEGMLYNNYMSAKYIAQINAKNPNVSDEVKKSFGLPFGKFVLACFYGTVPCTADDFIWYYDMQYGNCYRFNSGYNQTGEKIKLKTSNKPGPLDGFILNLFVGVPQNNNSFATSIGAHVFIHNDSILPTQFEGLDIAPGAQANLILKKEFIDRLPFPYNECYDNLGDINAHESILFKTILKLNQTYRQRDCYRLCYQKAAIAECKCYDLNFPRLFNADPCLTVDQTACTYGVYLSYYESDLGEKCGALCPLECDSVIYSVTTSFGQFPSRVYADFLMSLPAIQEIYPDQKVTYELIRESMLLLYVYFDETKYSFYGEEPSMNIVDLIANVGGTLGLFLGISFLSFVEIAEILIQIIFLLADHSSQKRKKVAHIGELRH